MTDTSDKKEVKKAIKTAKQKELARREALKHFMSSAEGREYFFALLVRCHVGTNPYARDPVAMAFNCGELNIGQQIMAELQDADISLYMQMMREGNEKSTEETENVNDTDPDPDAASEPNAGA